MSSFPSTFEEQPLCVVSPIVFDPQRDRRRDTQRCKYEPSEIAKGRRCDDPRSDRCKRQKQGFDDIGVLAIGNVLAEQKNRANRHARRPAGSNPRRYRIDERMPAPGLRRRRPQSAPEILIVLLILDVEVTYRDGGTFRCRAGARAQGPSFDCSGHHCYRDTPARLRDLVADRIDRAMDAVIHGLMQFDRRRQSL